MISIGQNKIGNLYLGETGIEKAYLGNNLVFEKAGKSRLPEGYTELQYIENPNLAAIASFGMTSTFMLSTKMELDVGFVENYGGTLIGTRLNENYKSGSTTYINRYAYFITVNYQTKVVTLNYGGLTGAGAGNGYKSATGQGINGRNKIIVKVGTDAEFSINGVQYDIEKKDFTNPSNMLVPGLFAHNYRQKTSSSSTTNTWVASNERINCIFYSMKYYDTDNKLVYEYVPCRQESDGGIGIFEIFSQNFYKGYDSKVFVAGPEV